MATGMAGQDAVNTAPGGKLDEAVRHAQSNSELAETLASEFHSLTNRYLGDEPPIDPEVAGADLEVCLYGGLLDHNQKIRRSLEQLQASLERLRSAYNG